MTGFNRFIFIKKMGRRDRCIADVLVDFRNNLLFYNSPSVIDQLNLSPTREATSWYVIGWCHEGNKLHKKTLLVIFCFYSYYDQTSGIIWLKKKVHNAIVQ